MTLILEFRGSIEKTIDGIRSDLDENWKLISGNRREFNWYMKGWWESWFSATFFLVNRRGMKDDERRGLLEVIDERFKVIEDKINDLPDH